MRRVTRLIKLSILAWCACCFVTTASSFAHSNGRVYEMVSPAYKGGYDVTGIKAVEPAGETVLFDSKGGFSGALSGGVYGSHYYLARRGSMSWSTGSLEPAFGGWSDVSENLGYAFASGPLGPNAGAETQGVTEEIFQLHNTAMPDTAESWEAFGDIVLKRLDGGSPLVIEEGASGDLCHIVVGDADGALLPAAENTQGQIYDVGRGCGGEPSSLKLIGLTNSQIPIPINRGCTVALGTGPYAKNPLGPLGEEQESRFNAISENGSEIFFMTNIEEGSSACHQESVHEQVFVRVGGNRTLEISRPLESSRPVGGCVSNGIVGEVPCEGALTRANAYFKGASEDGSKVFFTTTAPLVNASESLTNNLYMATIGCPGVESLVDTQSCEPAQREVTSLTQVSHSPVAKEAEEVQGVVRIAPDGSRVYFVAQGVLGNGGNAQNKAPMKGADNLYVYDSNSGTTAFVADLCSGPGRSGLLEDVRCPHDLTEGGADAELLWRSEFPEAQSTHNGAFLVFCTYAQLLPGDTDSAKDVYRYDAETGALDRVSVGENNYDANGDDNAFDANIEFGFLGFTDTVYSQHEMATRAINEDGSRIVFATEDPLSPAATNGRVNIYEWNEGNVSLVSTGTAEENDGDATITASGRDIFFVTSQGLARADGDNLPDVYDARIGGGFPPPPTESQPCSGDACQGPLTNPAALLVPGSVSQAPGGNFAAPAAKPVAKPKKVSRKAKSKKKRGKQKKKKASGRSGRTFEKAGRTGR